METDQIFKYIHQFGSVDLDDVMDGLVAAIQENELQNGYIDYQNHLDTLYRLLEFFNSSECEKTEEELRKICSFVLRTVCMLSLKRTSSLGFWNQDICGIFSKTYALLKLCLKKADSISCLDVLQLGLHSTESFILLVSDEEKMARKDVDVHCALEIFNCFTSTFSCEKVHNISEDRNLTETFVKSWESMYHLCINLLSVLEEKRSQNLLVSVLLKLLVSSDAQSVKLTTLWHEIQKNHDVNSAGCQTYSILCCLSNLYFPVTSVTNGLDLRCSNEFWHIIQTGLPNNNPLVRKQCLYLLKRIVDTCEKTGTDVGSCDPNSCRSLFWWKASETKLLVRVWEDFILLYETLEEKQVHVIKPLLSRFQNLIKATTVSDTGFPLLHSSWLTVIISRCFHHESIFIMRWAVDTVTSLDLSSCPLLEQGQEQFLTGPFLCCLHEVKLFIRPPDSEVGTCPTIGSGLVSLFQNCWRTLVSNDNQSRFFCPIVSTLNSKTWSPIPLLFIFKALSDVPPSPLLDCTAVKHIREVMCTNLMTMDSYLGSVLLYFCGQIFRNLLDFKSLCCEDIFEVLSVFEHNGCLKRGTSIWQELVEMLKLLSETNTESWSKKKLCGLLERQVQGYLQAERVSQSGENQCLEEAELLLLLADAGILAVKENLQDRSLSLQKVVGYPCEVVLKINSYAYMPSAKADRAIHILVTLVNHLGAVEDETSECIHAYVRSCYVELTRFICRRVTEDITEISHLPSLDIYQSALQHLSPLAIQESPQCLDELCVAAVRLCSHTSTEKVTMEASIKQLSGMVILGEMALLISEKYDMKSLSNLILKNTVKMRPSSSLKRPAMSSILSQKDWGKLSSRYLYSQWSVFRFLLQSGGSLDGVSPVEMLESALEVLNLGSEDINVPVFGCLKILLPEVLKSDGSERIETVFDMGWRRVKDSKHFFFWSNLQAFISIVFQSTFLKCPEDSEIFLKLNQLADDLLSYGEDKRGVVNMLVTHLCQQFSEPEMLDHLVKYHRVLVNACFFGPVPNRAQRQLFDLHGYLETLRNIQSTSLFRSGFQVRATIINFLGQLRPADVCHQRHVTNLIKELQAQYTSISWSQKSGHFTNCLSHRQKHRLLQFIVLLMPFITENLCDDMWDFLWKSLMIESQASVRHMLEWIAISMVTRFTKFIADVWLKIQTFSEKKNIAFCSMLCVISHVGPHLDHSHKIEFYNKSLTTILPLCMAHHFNSRIHSQATLIKLWKQCQEQKLQDVLQTHSIIEQCIVFSDHNCNSIKNVKKLLENFFFQTFHFSRDFTLETIFHTIPKLSSLADDEWISPGVFIKMNSAWANRNHSYIPLYNQSDDLMHCTAGPWKVRGQVWEERNEDGEEVDVQKKIMPWRLMSPDEEIQAELEFSRKCHKQQGLILITSLIDKVPNLGGLCRTSEIFGVSEYVISRLKFTEEKQFQNLSVTAQKWIPITEVPPEKLFEFLQEKKQEGYTLVGVEQTANSVCLTEYKFPVKTLLLLGNEKEGIPVELINVLDVCVEIPQQGVIRSLNVHVSGALLVWEYRRQQLVQEIQTNSC
ncbi:hypothetical protein ScPMuIL_013985 [Solemya velum]